MILKGLKFAVIGLMTLLSSNVMGQDLLAKQAPIDRKMRGVDSVALQRLVVKETGGIPSATLYPNWDNSYVNSYSSALLPEKFDIDLRGFAMPTTNRVITSNFGPRWGRDHKGIDVKVYVGDTIRAAFDGMIRVVDYQGAGYGKYIVIRHDNGLETVYGHLSKQLVKINQPVKAGDVIGLGGNTGRSTGSHLHFETRLLGVAINPALLFDFENQDVTKDIYTYRRGYSDRVLASSSRSGKSSSAGQSVGRARFHKVHKGDTLSSIARRYGMTVQQLCKKNGISKNAKLQIGQVIKCS
ncbi:MAG: peptidoglycan DD-metalloendopeptidase family protein [Bacteroidaceae bacterium]|nr:peptidoglycan DD-metalloendopeptidase family protein [Bacteroidaceae bacterium]